jgi:hypothetical protein
MSVDSGGSADKARTLRQAVKDFASSRSLYARVLSDPRSARARQPHSMVVHARILAVAPCDNLRRNRRVRETRRVSVVSSLPKDAPSSRSEPRLAATTAPPRGVSRGWLPCPAGPHVIEMRLKPVPAFVDALCPAPPVHAYEPATALQHARPTPPRLPPRTWPAPTCRTLPVYTAF